MNFFPCTEEEEAAEAAAEAGGKYFLQLDYHFVAYKKVKDII